MLTDVILGRYTHQRSRDYVLNSFSFEWLVKLHSVIDVAT